METLLGKKIGMTQLFEEGGQVSPVTVVEAGPCIVTQVKQPATDGYSAVQIGFGAIRPKLVNKPERGHFSKADVPPSRWLREVRLEETSSYSRGQHITVEIFAPGDRIKVTGTSKGKGFQGVVKRFHFHGGDMTHGSMVHRKPQSSGATDAARTFKGTRKPGHMGNETVTVRGLQVVRVDAERNLLFIKGAVPGPSGGLVTISKI
ncbi:MAG: 50S ribosomal protein L3 [Armatimonadetes bacterium]|nr:50S ribosomal protein L3 [Armatimonadota bacterium]